jgi:hypothetical protein
MSQDGKMRGHLTVTVHRAVDLQDVQAIGKQDPYCKLNVGSETFKTKVHDNGGVNPVWEQAFTFNLDGKEEFLHIMINDKDVLTDDCIGRADIALVSLAETSEPQWFAVVDRSNFKKLCGKIQLTGDFKGTGGPVDRKKALEEEKKKHDEEVKRLEAEKAALILAAQQQAIAFQQQQIATQQQLIQQQAQTQHHVEHHAHQPQVVIIKEEAKHTHHEQRLPATVTFKSYHGKFICAEKNHSVVADRDVANAWETWTAEYAGPNKYHFKSYHGRYLCAEKDHSMTSNREKAQAYETFTVHHEGNTVTLLTFHGKFVCAEPSGKLVGDRDKANAWEKFTI